MILKKDYLHTPLSLYNTVLQFPLFVTQCRIILYIFNEKCIIRESGCIYFYNSVTIRYQHFTCINLITLYWMKYIYYSHFQYFVLAFAQHVSSRSAVQRRVYIKGDSDQTVNRDGETITITPSRTFDIYCSDTRYIWQWYRVSGQSESSIIRLSQTATSPDVYAINTHGHVLTLQFRPFQSTHAGEYECRFTSHDGHTLTPLSVFLSKLHPQLLFLTFNL